MSGLRPIAAALLVTALTSSAPASARTLSFMAWDFIYASIEAGPEACPEGFNLNSVDLLLGDQTPPERERLSLPENRNELVAKLGRRGILNACTNPTQFKNYGLKTYQGRVHNGFNLDGAGTTTPANAPANTCAHPNFVSPSGEDGIDNQHGRVVGCIRGYVKNYDFDRYATATLSTGEYSVLVEITGVDDDRNDPDVTVAFYSGQGAVSVDAAGKLLPFQSVSIHSDRQYHNIAKGKIVDGVITTEPINLRLRIDQQVIHSDYFIRDSRFRGRVLANGEMEGLIGGYFDLEKRWEHVEQVNIGTSILQAYNCPGFYSALNAAADGYPDPVTGKCTAISSAFRVRALPAFIIHPDDAKQTAQSQ